MYSSIVCVHYVKRMGVSRGMSSRQACLEVCQEGGCVGRLRLGVRLLAREGHSCSHVEGLDG